MSKPSDELIEVPTDFFSEFSQPARQGLVYYDEKTGDIRGLSFVADEALAPHPSIFAPEETIISLMNAPALSDWVVDAIDDEMRLINIHENSVALDFVQDEDISLLRSDSKKTAQVSLSVKVSRTGGYIGFQLGAASKRLAMKIARDQSLYFVVTRRGNPEAILGMFNISLADLATRGIVTRRLSKQTDKIDIYTQRCSPLDYFIEEVDNLRPVFELPDVGFEDVVLYSRARLSESLEPALVATVEDGELVLRHHHGGGAIYDRPMQEYTLALTAPRDKHRLLAVLGVLVADLEKGEARVPLPENMVDQEFDICGQLLYHTVYDVRAPSN